jgi:carbonic anhydrase/acetyltransferase-like protein (isoleucine patch superfamily)
MKLPNLGIHLIILALFVLALLQISCRKSTSDNVIEIHPTAEVHPTAILEGDIKIGAYSYIGAGSILTGEITMGHHSLIQCNVTIRGINRIGNYVHIYDNVNIEGGRPANEGTVTNTEPDQSIISDSCWINHGAVMHGTQMGVGSAVGLGTACDYNTHIGADAILANGSATTINQIIPDNSFAEGVPAVVKKENINEEDRLKYFGLSPSGWIAFEAAEREAEVKGRLGIK